MELITQIINFIYWYLKPLVKWFLRKTTRLCELQRVCYGELTGAPRTLAVGRYPDLATNIQHPIDIIGIQNI